MRDTLVVKVKEAIDKFKKIQENIHESIKPKVEEQGEGSRGASGTVEKGPQRSTTR